MAIGEVASVGFKVRALAGGDSHDVCALMMALVGGRFPLEVCCVAGVVASRGRFGGVMMVWIFW